MERPREEIEDAGRDRHAPSAFITASGVLLPPGANSKEVNLIRHKYVLGGLRSLMSKRVVDKKGATGVVRFVGYTDFALGAWIGIELDKPIGKNDGSVGDKRYFLVKKNHGKFVRPTAISVDKVAERRAVKSRGPPRLRPSHLLMPSPEVVKNLFSARIADQQARIRQLTGYGAVLGDIETRETLGSELNNSDPVSIKYRLIALQEERVRILAGELDSPSATAMDLGFPSIEDGDVTAIASMLAAVHEERGRILSGDLTTPTPRDRDSSFMLDGHHYEDRLAAIYTERERILAGDLAHAETPCNTDEEVMGLKACQKFGYLFVPLKGVLHQYSTTTFRRRVMFCAISGGVLYMYTTGKPEEHLPVESIKLLNTGFAPERCGEENAFILENRKYATPPGYLTPEHAARDIDEWMELIDLLCRGQHPTQTYFSLRGVPVTLHIYDVSKYTKASNAVTRRISGAGAFHVGVEIFGREYSFGFSQTGTGLFANAPKVCPPHVYRETIAMPDSMLTMHQVHQVIAELKGEWVGTSYSVVHRNCCDFVEDFCTRLGVGIVPRWINALANAVPSRRLSRSSWGDSSSPEKDNRDHRRGIMFSDDLTFSPPASPGMASPAPLHTSLDTTPLHTSMDTLTEEGAPSICVEVENSSDH